MKGKKYDEKILKNIYVPCTIQTKGDKEYFRKIPILSCIKRCQSDLIIHEECKRIQHKRGEKRRPCEKWKEYLPKDTVRKKIHYKIHYKVT